MSGILLLNEFNDGGALDATVILCKNKRWYVLLMNADMKAHKRCGKGTLKSSHGIEPEHVYYLGDKEFEDLFDDETWVATLYELPQVAFDGAEPEVRAVGELADVGGSPTLSGAIQNSAEQVSLEGRSMPKLGVRVARKAIELDCVPASLAGALDYIAQRAAE